MACILNKYYFLSRSKKMEEQGVVKTGLRHHHLNDELFKMVAAQMGLTLVSWKPIDIGDGASFINAVVGNEGMDGELFGHLAFKLKGKQIDGILAGQEVTKEIIVRNKKEAGLFLSIVHTCVERDLGKEFADQVVIGNATTQGAKLRDVLLAKSAMSIPDLQAIMPTVYHIEQDKPQGLQYFVMERFNKDSCSHIDALEGLESFESDTWGPTDVQQALCDIASIHAKYLDRCNHLPPDLKASLLDGVELFANSKEFIKLAIPHRERFGRDYWKENTTRMLEGAWDKMGQIIEEFNQYPKTLVHNDFSGRNACLRRCPGEHQRRLCLYDWELACTHVPQWDVAVFLLYTLPEGSTPHEMNSHAEFYRQSLRKELVKHGHGSDTIENLTNYNTFTKIYEYAMMAFILYTASYLVQGTVILGRLSWFDKVERNAITYLSSISPKYSLLQ